MNSILRLNPGIGFVKRGFQCVSFKSDGILMDSQSEIDRGQRFAFGRNWKNFSSSINESQISEAQKAIQSMLGMDDLKGKTFLDVGCGSGLMSLAALRLGATVHSFDFDQHSVESTRYMKKRFAPDDDLWVIEQGSVLDAAYMASLGGFDIVYSWGVLHHTGEMYAALDKAIQAVKEDGLLYISIYNDQGGASNRWRLFKKFFNICPGALQTCFCVAFLLYWELRLFVARILNGKNPLPWKYWNASQGRGMSLWYDALDWLGGYPFEVAKPEEIFDYGKKHELSLLRMATCGGGKGCNEYVFHRKRCQ